MEKYNTTIAGNDNVELIHLSADQSEDKAAEWAANEKFPWPTILADKIGRSGLDQFKPPGYPTYMLVDKDGKKLAQAHGSAPIFAKLKEVAK